MNSRFRWDRWLQAGIVSTFSTVMVGGGAAYFTDGTLTGKEAVMLAGMALAVFGSYCAQHPPKFEEQPSAGPPAAGAKPGAAGVVHDESEP